MQPVGVLTPSLLAGQSTAWHVIWAGMELEHVVVVLDTGANPGRHAENKAVSPVVVLEHALPDPVTATVELLLLPPTGAMQMPLASVRRPRDAHVAMAAS